MVFALCYSFIACQGESDDEHTIVKYMIVYDVSLFNMQLTKLHCWWLVITNIHGLSICLNIQYLKYTNCTHVNFHHVLLHMCTIGVFFFYGNEESLAIWSTVNGVWATITWFRMFSLFEEHLSGRQFISLTAVTSTCCSGYCLSPCQQ